MAGLPCVDITDPICDMVKSCETTTNISNNTYINEDGVSANIVTTNVLSVDGNGDLISTVNGVVSNPEAVGSSVTNTLDSAANVMTSTVNGVVDSAPIINSNTLTYDVPTNTLQSEVNGITTVADLSCLKSNAEAVWTNSNPVPGFLLAGGATSGTMNVLPGLAVINNLSTCRTMVGTSVHDVKASANETGTSWAQILLAIRLFTNGGAGVNVASSYNAVGPASLSPSPLVFGMHVNYVRAFTIAPGATRTELVNVFAINQTAGTTVQMSGAFVGSVMSATHQ